MDIPIQNIYYLLCYAWDKLEEAEPVSVDSDTEHQLLNLFAKVLSERLKWLLKKVWIEAIFLLKKKYSA